ncbi:MAG TPA: hypothetical protein VIZ28_07165 [Chitinophagaceae bacterium]
MKITRPGTAVKNIRLAVLAVGMIFLFDSCATKINFLSSSVVPAAHGTVKVKKDNNNNYNIQIDLLDLAEPGRLEPARQTYIVWMEAGQDLAKNMGKITSSTSLLSKKFKASFSTVTSSKPGKIFITAEDDANIQYPGSQIVLTTGEF